MNLKFSSVFLYCLRRKDVKEITSEISKEWRKQTTELENNKREKVARNKMREVGLLCFWTDMQTAIGMPLGLLTVHISRLRGNPQRER
jgi:hypothetical protein